MIGTWGDGGGSVSLGGGSVPGGTIFRWHAEFRNDAGYDPKCCEVRQLINWNRGPFGPNTVPHSGFPKWGAGVWLEDRNKANKRYGRRSGPYHDPSLSLYRGNEYDADDRPSGPPNPGLSFRISSYRGRYLSGRTHDLHE
jgi:hypothetical protein